MANNRKQNTSTYDHLYTVMNGERGTHYHKCVYCGDAADTRDHVPPISRIDDYRSLKLEKEIYIKVPCCKNCNTLAGNTLQDTFLDRAEYVKDRIESKYKKYLKQIDWTDEELKELGHNLKSKVLENSKKGEIYRKKIEYYAGIDSILSLLNV